jgi:hypothetical protein
MAAVSTNMPQKVILLTYFEDIFTKGMDSSMYHLCYNGKWQAWQGLYAFNPRLAICQLLTNIRGGVHIYEVR